MTTLNTPAGRPASSPSCASARAVSGVASAGLTTMVQPAASAGPTLRPIIASGKVPRRDGGADTDRLLDGEDALVGGVGRYGVAVGALAFLGEPLNKGRAVGDLALGFGQRLAAFQRHQFGQAVLVGHDQIEPAAQYLGARLGGLLFPVT